MNVDRVQWLADLLKMTRFGIFRFSVDSFSNSSPAYDSNYDCIADIVSICDELWQIETKIFCKKCPNVGNAVDSFTCMWDWYCKRLSAKTLPVRDRHPPTVVDCSNRKWHKMLAKILSLCWCRPEPRKMMLAALVLWCLQLQYRNRFAVVVQDHPVQTMTN